MSATDEWFGRRQREWDERHLLWAAEQREREEREGTDYWKATQPKSQSFFDWSESEREAEATLKAEATRRAAEEKRRTREDFNRLLEDHVAAMGGADSVPAFLGVLGLGREATVSQVKEAYRRLALIHHPDKGGEAAEFHRVKRAHDQALVYLGRRRK